METFVDQYFDELSALWKRTYRKSGSSEVIQELIKLSGEKIQSTRQLSVYTDKDRAIEVSIGRLCAFRPGIVLFDPSEWADVVSLCGGFVYRGHYLFETRCFYSNQTVFTVMRLLQGEDLHLASWGSATSGHGDWGGSGYIPTERWSRELLPGIEQWCTVRP